MLTHRFHRLFRGLILHGEDSRGTGRTRQHGSTRGWRHGLTRRDRGDDGVPRRILQDRFGVQDDERGPILGRDGDRSGRHQPSDLAKVDLFLFLPAQLALDLRQLFGRDGFSQSRMLETAVLAVRAGELA